MTTLPKISRPVYQYELPITKQDIKIYPYVLKHHKVLLMALEGNDQQQILNHSIDVIKDCLHPDSQTIDINSLPFIDFEYLFIKLRAISLDDNTPIQAKCPKCDHQNSGSLNLNDTLLTKKTKTNNVLNLNDEITLTFNLPTVSKIYEYNKLIKNIDEKQANSLSIYTHVKDVLYKKEKVEFTKEEFMEWLEELDVKNYEKISDYISNSPKIYFELTTDCAKCKHNFKTKISGFSNFFIY